MMMKQPTFWLTILVTVSTFLFTACGPAQPETSGPTDGEVASEQEAAEQQADEAESAEASAEHDADEAEHQAEEAEHHAEEADHEADEGEQQMDAEHHADEAEQQADAEHHTDEAEQAMDVDHHADEADHHAEENTAHTHVHADLPEEYAGLTNPLAGDQEAIAAGKEIYQQNCASCHGEEGTGHGPAAAALDPQPASLADQAMMQDLSDAYLFWRVSEGGAMEPFNSAMPAWKDTLTEMERWQVVSYIRTFSEE